jgi:hypothetical protein
MQASQEWWLSFLIAQTHTASEHTYHHENLFMHCTHKTPQGARAVCWLKGALDLILR